MGSSYRRHEIRTFLMSTMFAVACFLAPSHFTTKLAVPLGGVRAEAKATGGPKKEDRAQVCLLNVSLRRGESRKVRKDTSSSARLLNEETLPPYW